MIITADKTKNAPKLAAIGKDQLEIEAFSKNPPKIDEPKINKQLLNLHQRKYLKQKVLLKDF